MTMTEAFMMKKNKDGSVPREELRKLELKLEEAGCNYSKRAAEIIVHRQAQLRGALKDLTEDAVETDFNNQSIMAILGTVLASSFGEVFGGNLDPKIQLLVMTAITSGMREMDKKIKEKIAEKAKEATIN